MPGYYSEQFHVMASYIGLLLIRLSMGELPSFLPVWLAGFTKRNPGTLIPLNLTHQNSYVHVLGKPMQQVFYYYRHFVVLLQSFILPEFSLVPRPYSPAIQCSMLIRKPEDELKSIIYLAMHISHLHAISLCTCLQCYS